MLCFWVSSRQCVGVQQWNPSASTVCATVSAENPVPAAASTATGMLQSVVFPYMPPHFSDDSHSLQLVSTVPSDFNLWTFHPTVSLGIIPYRSYYFLTLARQWSLSYSLSDYLWPTNLLVNKRRKKAMMIAHINIWVWSFDSTAANSFHYSAWLKNACLATSITATWQLLSILK